MLMAWMFSPIIGFWEFRDCGFTPFCSLCICWSNWPTSMESEKGGHSILLILPSLDYVFFPSRLKSARDIINSPFFSFFVHLKKMILLVLFVHLLSVKIIWYLQCVLFAKERYYWCTSKTSLCLYNCLSLSCMWMN